jgi:hypothetical protein
MADKRASGSKKAARKKGQLKNLTTSSQELSEGQAKAVKGGDKKSSWSKAGDEGPTENITFVYGKLG